MSSRYYSRRPRTRSSRISRDSTIRGDADDSPSHSAAASGERAWDYLLRRKTEHINDRIHKRKGMEFEEEKAEDFSESPRKIKEERIESDEDLPLHMRYQEISCSRSYTTSRGFWNDTEGEWLNKEMPVRVKSEPDDDHNTMSTSRSHYFERETTTLRGRRPESPPVRVKSEPVDKPNTFTARSRHCDGETTTLRERIHERQRALDVDYATKFCYDRNVPGDDIPRDLIANVSNYIEDARRATKRRHSGTSIIADDDRMYSAEIHQPANESYGRNVRDHNLIHIPTDTKIARPMQNHRRNSADRMSYGGSNERYQSYGQALYQDTSNYSEDSYHDTNQSHRRPMANGTSSHNRPNYYDDNDDDTNLGTRQSHGRYITEDTRFHNRQNNNEAAYPTITQGQRTHMPYELLHRNWPLDEGDDGSCHPAIQTHGRLTPNDAFYHNQLHDDEATFNATGQRNGHYETLYYNGTNSSYNCSYLTEGQSEERDMPNETFFHNPPTNNDEDLRHLLNIKSRGKSPVVPDMPFDPPLMQNTQDSVEDTCLPGMQGGKKDNQATAGNRTLIISSLPYPAEGVEVVYTADSVEADAWLRNNVVDCDVSAVGFDIEWKPQFVSKKKGGKENKTAVLQLAVEKSCLVLHLHHMETLPNYLNSVLTDPKVVKVGSGILQDVTKLKRDTRLKCVGFEDTQTLARSVGVPRSSKFGLKALADRFLGVQLSKPKSISKSNWEKSPLRIQQIHYAALDAWIGLKIYQCLKRMKDAGTTVALSHSDTSIAVPTVEAIPCHVCNKKCKDKVALEQHMKTVHANGETAQMTRAIPVGKIRCHVCNKKVKDNNALTQHLNVVHAKCKCGMFFMAKIEKSHRRKCTALKADKKTCTKVSSSTSVEKEVATLPMHVCRGCGKKCKTTEKLIEHIREVQHVSCPFCSILLPIVSSSSHIQKCQKFLGGLWKELSTGQVSSTANA